MDTDIVMSFDQFYHHVDRYISRRLGIGLESLADVDIWDYWVQDSAPIEWWRQQVREAAQYVMDNQDCVDSDIMSLFD